MKQAVIIFTRVPVAGRTKTRLMPFLSPEECAQLHKRFICDTYHACAQAGADIFVCYTPEGLEDILKDSDIWREENIGTLRFFAQEGDGLGERMSHAFETVFQMRYEKVLLIGTDIPQITADVLRQGFEKLNKGDVAINPTVDGGYYMIGMKELHPEVWNVPRYGGNTVMQDTLFALEETGLHAETGPVYRDIDTKEDLKQLYEELKISDHSSAQYTREYIRKELRYRLEELYSEEAVYG